MIFKTKYWRGAVEQEVECNVLEIVHLFRRFNKYDPISDLDLLDYLRPFLETKQFKIFKTNGYITGYVSYAYFDDLNQHIFKNTGVSRKLKSGDNIWVIDLVSSENVKYKVKWIANYFAKKHGANVKINYLRVDQYNNIATITSKLTKEYHKKWAE